MRSDPECNHRDNENIIFDLSSYMTAPNAFIIANITMLVPDDNGVLVGVPIRRRIALDNDAPATNIARVRAVDQLYTSHIVSWQKDGNDIIDKYIYSIPNDFAFVNKLTTDNEVDITDTYRMEYQEVRYNLYPMSGAPTPYNYSPFAFATNENIAIQAGQVRYFLINEYDEAGNKTSYYIKLRGEGVTDTIVAQGISGTRNLLSQMGNLFGQDITVQDVTSFWDTNPNFRFSYTINDSTNTNAEFLRYSFDTTREMIQFENFIKTMLEKGRADMGHTIEFTYNDGYGQSQYIRVSQANLITPLIEPETSPAGAVNELLAINLKNRGIIDQMFEGLEYKVYVYRILFGRIDWNNPVNEGDYNFSGSVKTIASPDMNEKLGEASLAVEVVDSFGRSVLIEHHSAVGLMQDVIFNGQTRYIGNLRYTGDERGVQIIWNNMTYSLTLNGQVVDIYNPQMAAKYQIQQYYGNDVYILTVLPFNKDKEGGDTTYWEAKLTFRISLATLPVERWNFYHVLPELEFRNLNGFGIDKGTLNSQEGIGGMVEVTLDRRGFLFGTSVMYTITHENGITESIPINRFATRFILDKVGHYLLVVSNDVSSRKEIRIYIREVDNVNYKIKNNIDGEWIEIDASPVLYTIDTGTWAAFAHPADRGKDAFNIPVYWIQNGSAQIGNLGTQRETYQNNWVQVIPTLNHNRILYAVGNYATIGAGSSIVQFQVYRLTSVTTEVSMYFAIATTSATPDSNLLGYNDVPVASTIYRTFSDVGEEGVTYKLSYESQASRDGSQDIRLTNVYYIEYKQNGIVGGRAFYGDPVRIEKQDYGIIELRIKDWAGNFRPFTGSVTGQQNLVTADCFTIYNFSKPPVLINNETVVNEMVYNDAFTISALANFPAFINGDKTHYVSSMEIERDGILVDTFYSAAPHEKFEFTYEQGGSYTIRTVFETMRSTVNGGSGAETVSSTHHVHLVETSKFMQAFTLTGHSNISVDAIYFGGRSDITRQFGEVGMKKLNITTAHANGRYTLVLRVDASNLRESYTVERIVYVASLDINGGVVTASRSFGKSHSTAVTISFIPLNVMRAANNTGAIMRVYRNGAEVAAWDIQTKMLMPDPEDPDNKEKFIERDISAPISYDCTSDGDYMIQITSSVNGTTVFIDGFTLVGQKNQTSRNIFIGLGVGVLVAGLIFWRLRKGMRIK